MFFHFQIMHFNIPSLFQGESCGEGERSFVCVVYWGGLL